MSAPVDTSVISDQIRAEMQVKQFRDFLGQYNQLSENCFRHCVWDFRTRDVKKQEDSCVVNCVDKFTKVTQRIQERFQEMTMITNENAIEAAKKLGKL